MYSRDKDAGTPRWKPKSEALEWQLQSPAPHSTNYKLLWPEQSRNSEYRLLFVLKLVWVSLDVTLLLCYHSFTYHSLFPT